MRITRRHAVEMLAGGASALSYLAGSGCRRVPETPKAFDASWESLTRYQCPAWFRDAKFGIWAHWGPQCVPQTGDWYARNMYIEGSP